MTNTPLSSLRPDLAVMAAMVLPGMSILDIGCGEGEFLSWLVQHKQVRARGLELNPQKVNHCIGKGLSVMHANAEQELPYFADQSCDVVILSRTLQAMHDPVAVLNHVVRIGRQAIIAIPNFGYWRNRWHLAAHGRMPVTQTLSYAWYDTPNIHFCTIADFHTLCQQHHISISQQCFHDRPGNSKRYFNSPKIANLLAEQATFLITKDTITHDDRGDLAK